MPQLFGSKLCSGSDTRRSTAANPLNHFSSHSEHHHFAHSRYCFVNQGKASNLTSNIYTSSIRYGTYLRNNTPRRPRLHHLRHVFHSILQYPKRSPPREALRITNSSSLLSVERDPGSPSVGLTCCNTKQQKRCAGEVFEEKDGSGWHVDRVGGF